MTTPGDEPVHVSEPLADLVQAMRVHPAGHLLDPLDEQLVPRSKRARLRRVQRRRRRVPRV